jgi:hypothetical protein
MLLLKKQSIPGIFHVHARIKDIRFHGGHFRSTAAGFAGRFAFGVQRDVVAGGGLFSLENQ